MRKTVLARGRKYEIIKSVVIPVNDFMVEYFLTVADSRSFTKASETLFVSQPAVSKQVAALEHELGFTLIDRTQKPIMLTEAGKLFYEHFDQQRAALRRVCEKATLLNNERSGDIRLGCLDGWNVSDFFPSILSAFSKSYPHIRLSLESRGFRGLLDALTAGEVDAIITIDITLHNTPGILIRKLTELPRIIFYSANHPLSALENPSPIDFKDETFLLVAEKEVAGASAYIRAYCAPYGFEPRIHFVPNIESVQLGVENGMGVTISDYWSRLRTDEAIRHITLNSNHIISIAWSEGNDNPAIHILANELAFLFDAPREQV